MQQGLVNMENELKGQERRSEIEHNEKGKHNIIIFFSFLEIILPVTGYIQCYITKKYNYIISYLQLL